MSGSSVTRRPRMRLLLNGVPVTGGRSSEIVSSRGSQASSFRVVGNLGDLTRQLGSDWLDQAQLPVAIDYGFLPAGAPEGQLNWVRMITGSADRIDVDPVSGLISLDGRDNASRLIDLPLQDGYLNKTSSDVAQLLASRCGLQFDVDQTTGLVGQYYQIQHTRSAFASASRYGNAWDLLAELADLESFDLWVGQSTLYFKSSTSSRRRHLRRSLLRGWARIGLTDINDFSAGHGTCFWTRGSTSSCGFELEQPTTTTGYCQLSIDRVGRCTPVSGREAQPVRGRSHGPRKEHL